MPTIVREYNGIGIDSKLNGYNMYTHQKINKHVFNGRLCYKIGKTVVGISTLKKQPPIKIIIEEPLPF